MPYTSGMLRPWERETDTHIYFWRGILSQWPNFNFDCKISPDGDIITFNCPEQYMMASKAFLFGDFDTMQKIMNVRSPAKQKELGRKVKKFNLYIWEQHALSIVFRANWAKFTQDDHLKSQLLSTDLKTLVEGADYDKVWGVGLSYDDDDILDESKWKGTNWLGVALMNTRARLVDNDCDLTFEYTEID